MKPLSKEEAQKIIEITSSIFQQGNTWVMREWDLESGAERLTRGLSLKVAKKKLKLWQKERLELLLREHPEQPAFTVRIWHENPSWAGQGIWQWAQNNWYTTKEDAQVALDKKQEESSTRVFEVFEMKTLDVPGHFNVG